MLWVLRKLNCVVGVLRCVVGVSAKRVMIRSALTRMLTFTLRLIPLDYMDMPVYCTCRTQCSLGATRPCFSC